MDLPDCPPGAEGYEDSVVEMPKKPDGEETNCTKAEIEFQEHLSSLKIRLENGETRPMVERRGRDISGKWIYLCYPCAAVCSGELILQGHISGKKHKTRLNNRKEWPVSIFDDHPFNQCQKGVEKENPAITANVLKKMKDEVQTHIAPPNEFDDLFAKYREVTCHIQYSIDAIKAPLIGIEYLVEHPPEKEHYEPSYMCTLCTKQGHPRTIINHMTCFWHRYNYIHRHFNKAAARLKPLMSQSKYRDGISIILNRITQRIEDKYGRLTPLHIDKEIYEKEKDKLMRWIFKGKHFTEADGTTFEEVVDLDLIESLHKPTETAAEKAKKDPSPPRVAAPKRNQNPRSRNERRMSMELSDISDDELKRNNKDDYRSRTESDHKARWEPFQPKRDTEVFKSRFALRNVPGKSADDKNSKPPNYEYKMKLSAEKRAAAEDSARKMLAYHEKNPEKHPLYPEEWKKFWNRRYKEIQAEGKDPSKHDFKPEWILFWTKRMKELHDEELRVTIIEIYRKMNVSPPDMNPQKELERRRSSERRRSPDFKRFADHRRPNDYRRSPDRRRSPARMSREPRDARRDRERDFDRRRDHERRRSADRGLPDYRIGRRSPEFRPNAESRHSPRRRSPHPHKRSRSPISRRSPLRTNIVLDSIERSRSPLSCRNAEISLRNRSPTSREPLSMQTVLISDDEFKPSPEFRSKAESRQSPRRRSPHPHKRSRSPISRRSESAARSRSPLAARRPEPRGRSPARHPPPSMQTVLISDDEFKPEDNATSPWNSDNEIESVCSVVSRGSRRRRPDPLEAGPVENIVATLRMLVALEDYLGSIGPKIVDLLTEALKMEKDKANSSEELLDREAAMVLVETAKEKLKGAAQAGLVGGAAAPAVRAAVVRAAATLHHADARARRATAKAKKKASEAKKTEAMPVAGVGEVDRAQIAQQMAAALIAQGKTDVTSEELAQLVDAVVGMAEAKKREAEAKKAETLKSKQQPKMCGTATALQMLQSAYDENDKKEAAKEEVPDAMDGLSDSDLETLLKNFNELSAEEQHSLIAYLKKLEAREPQRVERLRQYVSAAATSTAEKPAPAPQTEPEPVKVVPPVVLESDDDDYTVEEVIESAQQKVKEDQMRKEIEIVKKSLEEMKEKEATPPITPAVVDISKNLSSASDLLALVQASIQSKTPVPAPSSISTHTSSVVVNSTQPRSFGDMPTSIETLVKSNTQFSPPMNDAAPNSAVILDEPMHLSPLDNFNEPFHQDEPVPPSNNYNQNDYNQGSTFIPNVNYNNQVDSYNHGDNYNPPQPYQNDSYNQGNNYNQNDSYNHNDNYNPNAFTQNQHFNQNSSYGQPWNNQRQNVPEPINQGFNNFNQGGPMMPNPAHNQNQPRGNFMNGNNKNQGNFNNSNNFRGRGRGQRGRGRGRF